MRKPDFTPSFLTPEAQADELRPQIAAAEQRLLNRWAETIDAGLQFQLAVEQLEILMALWPEGEPVIKPKEEDATVSDS